MTVTIHPSRASGEISAPPSKSMAHRLLIAAGLAEGESVVDNLAPSEDILATIDCLRALGATVDYENGKARVLGIGGKIRRTAPHLPCRECGSTLRFFIPIAAISEEISTFSGSERLFKRPLSVYETVFSEQKLPFSIENNTLTLRGKLSCGNYTVKGNISSQFITGLLFALPLLHGDSTITLLPPIESASYLDLTVAALKAFGVEILWQNKTTLLIKGDQTYKAGRITVEGDYSNAAFLSALAILGDDVSVTGLDADSLQGDRVYIPYFEKLKAGTPTLSLADCPDLGPVLMALAAALQGATFTDTARLAIKESDRGAAMAEELKKCGISCTVSDNTIKVPKQELTPPTEALSGHNDHRIVMALSILLTRIGGIIEGAEAINKSYPDFFTVLQALGIRLTTE